jgi:signal transduction histidine kinase
VKTASPSRQRLLPLAVAGVLLALLALLATLQWQWIGELSTAERRRMQASLESAADRFGEDFDREIARVVMRFHPAAAGERQPADWLAERWESWQDEAPYPGLVRAVLRVAPPAGPDCFSPARGVFEPCAEAAEARDVAQALSHAAAREAAAARHHAGMPAIVPEIPALVMPFNPGSADAGDGAELVVVIDRATLVEVLLPELTARHFGGARGDGYTVVVVERDSRPLYASEPELAASALAAPDAVRSLPGLAPFAELPASGRGRGRGRALARHAPWEEHEPLHFAPRRRGGRADAAMGLPRADGPRGPWTLAVKRRAGSVDQAVARFRWHNLAVSLCVLGLIAATAGVMTVSAQRAQRLARQRIEFVAGVTHELHTPLTAICSAGENLADGVVASPEQVKRYGALIEREGRRLADMVAQVLELAGIESGRRTDRREEVAAGELVEAALAASRWLLEEGGVEVERTVDADLPPLHADAAALARAVRNLIENAVKYGGGERWLGVRARREGAGVAIEVADRGPGIAREDLPRLFEPFYRGRSAARVAGSGLGLSLVRQVVEAHGGKVTVAPGPGGRGALFTLYLPAAVPA